MSNTEIQAMNTTIPVEYAGMRLDQALAGLFPDYSRSRIQRWIKKGDVKMNGSVPRPRDQVHGGENVEITPHADVIDIYQAEALPLALIYEDPHLLVINKPSGLVVHPAPGNWQGTLLNALLHHAPELKALPRAGIVHRLDKETSGLMVVARTLKAHKQLVDQLQARLIKRQYLALVQGRVISGGTINANVGRHPVHRKRMAVLEGAGKSAVTHYRVAQRFSHHTLLRVFLETGRTHQIRVHLLHIHHPVVGDPVYGGRFKAPPGLPPVLIDTLRGFKRQALHAEKLVLNHPHSHQEVQWQAPVPQDMRELIEMLSNDTVGRQQ